MTILDSFPAKVMLEPREAFRGLAGGRPGWAWPAAIFVLSTAASVLLYTLLPPQFLADSFEGLTFSRDRGFAFYFASSLAGGLALTAFICALVSALARYLGSGKLSVRIITAALAIGAYGILAAAMHGAAGGARAFGITAAAAGAFFAGWAGLSDGERYRPLLQAMLSITMLSLAGCLAGGAAALAGSVKIYTGAEYLFSLLSLLWLAKAISAVYGAAGARAAAAAVLALFGGLAFLFLVFNTGLVPAEVFQALMMA